MIAHNDIKATNARQVAVVGLPVIEGPELGAHGLL
jgi:hypothetical protein